jgi:hypothetical protein
MSRIKDPTILFQYKSTEKLLSLLTGTKQFVKDNSKEDIFNFFDLDDAVGLWLDQLGAFLNIERPLVSAGESNLYNFQDNDSFLFQDGEQFIFNEAASNTGTFIMDQSLMDSTDVLDGTALANDDLYKAYIKAQIARRNSRFTVEEIINVLQFTIAANSILLIEGDKVVSMFVAVPTELDKLNADLLSNLDPKWFGLPSGVGLGQFNTYVMPPTASFFIMDQSSMDDPNFLMI